MAVAIKVCYPYHAPASRKDRPKQAGAENVVVKIPYRRLSRASIVKQVIRMAVAIKVRYFYHGPADRKVGPNRPKLKALLLRYHIAVCRVLELNRR